MTDNGSLVRASSQFFADTHEAGGVPICMVDVSLTAQLWIRTPNRAPDLPRTLLIADCYAALNPSPELWRRWVRHVQRLREKGQISDEELQNLVFSQQARMVMVDVTKGDPDAIGDNVIPEVLARYRAELARPAEEQAEAERKRADRAEARAQATEDRLAIVEGQFRTLQEEGEAERAKRKARREVVRNASGYLVPAALVATFIVVWLTGVVGGKSLWASAAAATLFASGAYYAWAHRKPRRLVLTITIFVAVTSLIAGWWILHDTAPGEGPPRPPQQAP